MNAATLPPPPTSLQDASTPEMAPIPIPETKTRLRATSPHGAPSAESFAGRPHRQSQRLSESEADDLRYLWQGYCADLGIRSAHGSLEHRLLMAPPRDVWRPVLEELVDRHGGRACEGRITRVVVAEGWGTRSEVRQAIAYLCRPSARRGPRVERLATSRPTPSERCEGRCQHACSACLWTGYDLRATERGELRMALALGGVPKTRQDRWDAADDRLRAECERMACHGEGVHAPAMPEETLGARQRRAVNRATAALSRCTAYDARVLQAVYGVYHASEEAEVEAVRRIVGGDREKARAAIEKACEAYRLGRRAEIGMTLQKGGRKKGKAVFPRVRINGSVLEG